MHPHGAAGRMCFWRIRFLTRSYTYALSFATQTLRPIEQMLILEIQALADPLKPGSKNAGRIKKARPRNDRAFQKREKFFDHQSVATWITTPQIFG